MSSITMNQNVKKTVHNEVFVSEGKTKLSDLWKKEDWLAVWIGFILISVSAVSILIGGFDFSAAKFDTWGNGISVFDQLSKIGFWAALVRTFLVLGILFTVGVKLRGESVNQYVPAYIGLFILSVLVRFISAQFTLNRYLEWAFWALIVGLVVSNTVGVPKWLKPAVQTEYYIKAGLVGTRVLKMDNKPLVITVATATSVCGTSAAIATGAASKAKKTDLSLAVSISIIFTVIMMVFEPIIIKATGMSELMGGALIGGTVDSTGAVTIAGTAVGATAQTSAVLVKSIQNILIGFIAFAVAVFFTTRVESDASGKATENHVTAAEIWYRLPKFILGFFAASLAASFIFVPLAGAETVSQINTVLDQYKNWAFVLAFVSIGLDTNFKEIKEQFQGGKPLVLYVVGQLFNIVLTFAAVYILLSGKFFPLPHLV